MQTSTAPEVQKQCDLLRQAALLCYEKRFCVQPGPRRHELASLVTSTVLDAYFQYNPDRTCWVGLGSVKGGEAQQGAGRRLKIGWGRKTPDSINDSSSNSNRFLES